MSGNSRTCLRCCVHGFSHDLALLFSDFRKVEDHQEFFADPNADFSIITELDSYADVTDDQALA